MRISKIMLAFAALFFVAMAFAPLTRAEKVTEYPPGIEQSITVDEAVTVNAVIHFMNASQGEKIFYSLRSQAANPFKLDFVEGNLDRYSSQDVKFYSANNDFKNRNKDPLKVYRPRSHI